MPRADHRACTLFTLLLAAGLLIGCPASPPTTPGDPGAGDPTSPVTPPDSAMTRQLELDAFALVNDERTARGLAPLSMDLDQRAIARAHSQDMVARGFFDHTNPDGDDPFDRMADAGITYSTAAENIAWNQGYADPAQAAVDGWMASAGHRANILNPALTHTGMGVAERGSDGRLYFTQVFTGN
jgi:uncharacterized protein YkwD